MASDARSGALSDARTPERPPTFPLLLALLFILGTLATFFSSTVPTLRERDILRATHAQMQQLKGSLDTTLSAWRGREAAMDQDVETLLVEIDRLGMTPDDLTARREPKASPEFGPKANPEVEPKASPESGPKAAPEVKPKARAKKS